MNGKYFEIMVENGHYPLSRVCGDMYEAYGCLEDLKCLNENLDKEINMNDMMLLLVSMYKEEKTFYESRSFSIFVREGEI